MKISVHQPNYLPWIGYFDKLDQSDSFVILDKVNRANRGFLNRNSILTSNGKLLLTVPLQKGELQINKIKIDNSSNWKEKHWGAIEANYKKTPFWTLYKERFKSIYAEDMDYLCDLNIQFLKLNCEILNIDVKIYRESEFHEDFGTSSERIANIVQKLKGDIYISGSGARAYNNPDDFNSRGIKLLYQNFQHPLYSQKWGNEFTPNLSIIDLIFNHGPHSIDIIRSKRKELLEE
ncbi:WbqC family protein [Ureibacillus acetophenoni]|uniref:WbqC-like protein n=1 Tax=Ureibacillus acetophenoni TaxID=614649 RepID=A0A285UAF7_9BACL|nr:WbqC family protein [Ureibacillus acetophenoni]SOC38408.1 WbqC-like protein [Ureibacillus acetophenoni]